MSVKLLVSIFLMQGHCEILQPSYEITEDLVLCLRNIMQKYFRGTKQLVYIDRCSADGFLETIHQLNIASVINKTPAYEILPDDKLLAVTPYLSYMIVASDIEEFLYIMVYLSRETNWNPYARFLVIIKDLIEMDLKQIFDTLLHFHLNDIVVANGTATAELYSYNSFENYACGKYYTRFIEFGKCLDLSHLDDIYPVKVITGLRNCFFRVSAAHWPPYSINPAIVEEGTKLIGTEQHIFHLISEIEQFKYNFNFDYDPETFSFVTKNMSISGPMVMLQNNLTDVMLGGLMLIPSRANVFFYIHGHLDQVDEIRIMVQRAQVTPSWKDVYLEFSLPVWVLLLLALLFYAAMLAVLLRKSDKGVIIMTLLDNLLSHGPSLRCRQGVKLVFIIWVWFAFLINSFYITSLMSLTTKPSLGYQVTDEMAMKESRLVPCISDVMDLYRKTESTYGVIFANANNSETDDCKRFLNSIRSVGMSNRLFTIVLYSVYSYHKQEFYDRYERPPVYSFTKPYAKVIYAMYFYKGFPMYERLHALALRIRETGLSEKSLEDQYFGQKLKYHFHSKGFVSRFAIPWHVYIGGLFISAVTLVVELASQYKASLDDRHIR